MIRSKESVWAIGFRDQVEIRLFTNGRKPRAVKTDVEKDCVQTVMSVYEDDMGRPRIRHDRVPRKLTIMNTIHTGGKVIKVMPMMQFWRLTKITIPVGESLKLNSVHAAAILGKKHD